MTTWTPRLPFDADAMIEQLGEDIVGEFEDGEALADELCDLATAHKDRLDALLRDAWDAFVAETKLAREIEQEEEQP